jgi:hypothetical protein
MFPGAKIVAIDDDEDDLRAVLASLRALGLACVSYHYPDEQPGDKGFRGVRLFISDINLLGGGSPGDESKALAPVISLIERIIPEDNGPYALITWSTTTLHDALIKRIAQTGSLKERQPFFSTFLSKAELKQDATRLTDAVKNIFKKEASFGALLSWESAVTRSGEKVLRDIELFSQSFPGKTPSERMDSILSKLAVDAFGKQHVKDHRVESVNEALFPLLGDALNSEFFRDPTDDIWTKAVTRFEEDHKFDAKVISKLNSMVILEKAAGVKAYRRGALLEIPDKWLLGSKFEELFGATPLIFKEHTLKIGLGVGTRWVLVQAQAACDFAQPRIGPIPYLLAAIVPTSTKRLGTLPQSVWKSPQLAPVDSICDQEFCIEIIHGVAVNLTRRTLDADKFKVIGRLKDQIVGSISFEHHSHGSRPGFVSFRSK